jgi:hypothetical protein
LHTAYSRQVLNPADTPGLASREDGSVGLRGERYAGYLPVGDAAALATLLRRDRDDPAMLSRLLEPCAARAALFDPVHERGKLLALVAELLKTGGRRATTTLESRHERT